MSTWHEAVWACRECILAETEARHKCPLCRSGITAEGLREGVLPAEEVAASANGQGAGAEMQDEEPGPSTGGLQGADTLGLTLFESKLNLLLKEVLPCLIPFFFHASLILINSPFHKGKGSFPPSCREADTSCRPLLQPGWQYSQTVYVNICYTAMPAESQYVLEAAGVSAGPLGCQSNT